MTDSKISSHKQGQTNVNEPSGFEWFWLKTRAFQLRAQGFTAQMGRYWIKRTDLDRRYNRDVSRPVRRRAHRWGFLPETVRNLDISKENLSAFISERDYAFVQPLNGKYAKWVRDRVSTLTVFAPFTEWFEPVHYHFLRRDNQLHVIALSDEAQEYGPSLESLKGFVRDRGSLRLCSVAWGRGEQGELVIVDEHFLWQGRRYSDDQFFTLISRLVSKNFFVLTEHAEPAKPAEEIHITMMNPAGSGPRVAEARLVIFDELDSRDQLHKTAETAGIAETLNRDEYVSVIDHETGSYERWHRLDAGALVNECPSVDLIPTSGTISCWEEIVRRLETLGRFAPQLEFVQYRIVQTGDGPIITGVSARPAYSHHTPYSPDTVAFLRDRISQKKTETMSLKTRVMKWMRNAKFTTRKFFALAVYPKGIVPYQSVRWLGDMRRDFTQTSGISVKTKLWAYRHGFLSYRVPQYGITPENRTSFISDLEYRWLRHINTKYRYWLEDKISIKYVAADFSEYLPDYYFYTSMQGAKNHVVPMMDCPENAEPSFEGILRLAREKGVLALKPDEGSHGEGFYRLSYDARGYSLNNEPVTEQAVLDILMNPKNQYLITEFIEMHSELARIYPDSVNTIRMIVFKADGVTPTIGNSYLRIGSKKSGFVDNTSVGGMLAEIDTETGEYGNAQVLDHGKVTPCPNHPDTAVYIAGTIPNWELAKREVLRIASSIPQLEYFGFDVAITESGFKLPEINRFPDYPRIERLTEETTGYLLSRLQQKKRTFGYDVKPARRLISLPKREAR
ncbi:sugar-transfer associated ATP-grasp domain-containing protein [Leucobacter chinensis]|uniref:sugar-transfer associated ATP-grasp domain-containing protein n=1 Tax=Leucobacter chinensis TaxID=2851010 RepID=UPI001C234832|nr:sugar-transfer associated ATP-grasp domain-containing protein [Leucobacter chinensis]